MYLKELARRFLRLPREEKEIQFIVTDLPAQEESPTTGCSSQELHDDVVISHARVFYSSAEEAVIPEDFTSPPELDKKHIITQLKVLREEVAESDFERIRQCLDCLTYSYFDNAIDAEEEDWRGDLARLLSEMDPEDSKNESESLLGLLMYPKDTESLVRRKRAEILMDHLLPLYQEDSSWLQTMEEWYTYSIGMAYDFETSFVMKLAAEGQKRLLDE